MGGNLKSPIVVGTGLTAMQLVIAREIAKGRDQRQVRDQFKIGRSQWLDWMRLPEMQEAIRIKVEKFDKAVETALSEGELEAAATLIAALSATTLIKYKDGEVRAQPQWEVRLKAAISLLDRRGERGMPLQRVQSASVSWNGTDLAKQLAGALADPGVQQFLERDPHLAEQLRSELAQLPPPEEVPSESPGVSLERLPSS